LCSSRYNNRERLVNEPLTDYSHLTKCIKQFEPYASLWITCDDWKQQHKVRDLTRRHNSVVIVDVAAPIRLLCSKAGDRTPA